MPMRAEEPVGSSQSIHSSDSTVKVLMTIADRSRVTTGGAKGCREVKSVKKTPVMEQRPSPVPQSG